MQRIVLIGGGTGSYTVLSGLKIYAHRGKCDLIAIVSMTDNGGDTGRLRDEYGILPPGDTRRCLAALSEETEILRKLFQYRFPKGTLRGCSFGNLFLTALSAITGSDEKAIVEASKILKIRGQVFPVTLDKVELCVRLENGKVIRGESNIDIPKHDPRLKIEKAFLVPPAKAYQKALEAIKKADFIIIGPGDLYTSIIPNLLVDQISPTIRDSKARKVYICNLMTKHGETNDFDATTHLRTICSYLGSGSIDYIIVNSGLPPQSLLKKYEKEKSYPVRINSEELYSLGVKKVIEAEVMNKQKLIRHSSPKIAREIMKLMEIKNNK